MSYTKINSIMYDITDMIKTHNAFKEKLQGLIDLADYGSGKLGVYDEKLYVSWSWLQSMQRIYYGESRSKLIEFLKNVFDDYKIFNKMVNNCLLYGMYTDEITDITTEQNMLIQQWIKGLSILKEQYIDDTEVVEEINKITSRYTFY